MRLLSVLMSPEGVGDRQWEHRERELNAGFARGRKKLRQGAMLDGKSLQVVAGVSGGEE